jgi:hypothetical protein
MRLSGEILIGETALGARVEAMARAIAADTQDGGELSVVALMDGAFMFCADLVRRLTMPVRLALVPIKSIDRGGNPSALLLPDGFPLEGADVLVVEDILDTGARSPPSGATSSRSVRSLRMRPPRQPLAARSRCARTTSDSGARSLDRRLQARPPASIGTCRTSHS